MSKIRTYGIEKEMLESITEHIYCDLLDRTSKALVNGKSDMVDVVDILLNKPIPSKSIIMASLIFGIGNFDRIDKIECDAELNVNGEMEKPVPITQKYIS